MSIRSSNIILKGDGDSADYVVHLIDTIRSKLSMIDESLTDVHSLLQGYVNATNPQAQPTAPQPPVPPATPMPEPPAIIDDDSELLDDEEMGC